MVAQTGCDAVMIGRTAASNPWIFRQIAQYCASMKAENATGEPGRAYDEPTKLDRYNMIRTYFAMLIEEEMPGAAGKMKQFASWFTHGVPGGAALRKAIYEAHEEREILSRVEQFFEARADGGTIAAMPESAAAIPEADSTISNPATVGA